MSVKATYNINVTSAIIENSALPNNTSNKLYNVDGKLFFGDESLSITNIENTGIIMSNFSSSGPSNSVVIGRSMNSTRGSHTAVSAGNELGKLVFRGSDGTIFRDSALIKAEADGSGSSVSMPGILVFSLLLLYTTRTN